MCEVRGQKSVSLEGADYYYVAEATCTPASTPAQVPLDGLADAMAANRNHGVSYTVSNGKVTIHDWTGTMRCSSY